MISSTKIKDYYIRLQSFLSPIWNYKVTPIILVAILYTVFALIMTYPLGSQLSSGIVGSSGDSYQHLWAYWWAKIALIDLKTTMADVSMLYFPQGAHHPILWVTPWIQLAGLPFMLLFGPFITYNISFLLTIILSGVTTYMLAYEITGNRRAAFLGGLIFAFAPTRFIHALGHHAQTITYLFPLYTLFLVKLLKKPGLKVSLLAGILLTLSLLVNFMHLALIVIPTTLVLVGYYAWTQWAQFWEPKRIGALALTAGVALILTSPFFFPFIQAQFTGELGNLTSPGVSKYGADLLAFITPSPIHPALENYPTLRQAFSKITGIGYTQANLTEGIIYLGIIPLILAIWGIIKQTDKAKPWLLLGLITAVLSLGPLLKINGEYITYRVDEILSYIPLPYALLNQLPFYDSVRTPSRINMTTMLALAILVSLGIAALLDKTNWRARWKNALVITLIPIILFEYTTIWPMPIAKEPIPEFYTQIAQEPGDFGILDYPMVLLGYQSTHSFDFPMYYQMVHERPIAGGYIWRLPSGVYGTMRALDNLVSPQSELDILPEISFDDRVNLLNQLNFGYVIIHKQDTQHRSRNMPQDRLLETTEHMTHLLGEPVYDDQYITAFRVPETPPTNDTFLIALGENWGEKELVDNTVWRWTEGQESTINIYGQSDSPYQISFDIRSIQDPRHVQLSVNDELIGEMIVDQTHQFLSPPFSLPLEQNSITLKIEEDCLQSENNMLSEEKASCRNLQINQIELLPAQTEKEYTELNCLFDNNIELLGYDLSRSDIAAGENLNATLYWRANKPVEQSYTVFTHILNNQGQVLAQQDNLPVTGTYPTDWWMLGEIITDPYTISLPEDVPQQSDASLIVGLYTWPSGERLSIDESCFTATADNYVTLSTIKIRNKP